MRKLHAALLAAAGFGLAAGAASAQASAPAGAAPRFNTMNVALPDGSVAQIRYRGDVAPRIAVVPVDSRRVAAFDPFAQMDRQFAAMRARHAAMMRQIAELHQQARAGQPGQVVVSSNLPAGSYSYTVVSTTSRNGCSQTVRWSSDGSGEEPRITRTSAGDCGAVQKSAPAVPVAAPAKPEAPAIPARVLERQARMPAAST
jgi:hypothetical protein